MSRRDRVLVAALLLSGTVALVAVVAAAGQLCPAPTAGDPCLEADRNRLIVLGLAAGGIFALMTGGAFAVDFLAHRRIVYLGSWARAVRRGALTALTVAALAVLRLADALTGFSAIVVVVLALAVEWLAGRRLDAP